MAEIQTNTSSENFDPSAGNPFIGDVEFDNELARRSRIFVTQDESNAEEHITVEHSPADTKKKIVRVGVAATTALAAGVAFGPGLVDTLNGPQYSAESTTYKVKDGDGWTDVAEAIHGYKTANINELIDHIKSDPANIDAVLEADQLITIPVSVD